MIFRSIEKKDWEKISKIYQQGIDTGLATFETSVPDWDHWDKAHLDTCRVLVEDSGEVLGWAALSPVSDRCVYGGVGEVSVYVSDNAKGKGIGLKLLNRLIVLSEEEGLWSLQSGIFSDNTPSIRLHEKAGFRKIGIREKIGQLNGEWKDNLLMERRSKVVGVNKNEWKRK